MAKRARLVLCSPPPLTHMSCGAGAGSEGGCGDLGLHRLDACLGLVGCAGICEVFAVWRARGGGVEPIFQNPPPFRAHVTGTPNRPLGEVYLGGGPEAPNIYGSK